MSLAHLNELFSSAMSEFGMTGDGLDETGACTIRLRKKGMPPINMLYDSSNDTLDVFSEIGYVPEDDKDLYQDFLADNFFGGGTYGAVFSLDQTTNRIMLHRTLTVSLIADGAEFSNMLVAFAETAYNARRKIFRKALATQENNEMSAFSAMQV